VWVELCDERIPTRHYGGFSLPAGRYRALRVTLGEGEGRNWWCIVFPPVCLAAVEKEQLRPVMQPEDYDLLTREEGWELRFRCVELWGELLNALEGGG
ncbi:MAG: stage II sporulation protein R, partial [Oscillospiraceae bacterium]|nr:stage II sporulation protein R [Oscillospiraceae bacterium]